MLHYFIVLHYNSVSLDSSYDNTKTRIVNATPGTRVDLPCSPSLSSDIKWVRVDSTFVPIFQDGLIQESFRSRFQVDRRADGQQNLVVFTCSTTDCGTYVCIEANGHGRWHHVHLSMDSGMRNLNRMCHQWFEECSWRDRAFDLSSACRHIRHRINNHYISRYIRSTSVASH